MKKLVAVLMVLCMVLTVAAAFAEESEPIVVNWSDYEADAADIAGQFAVVGPTGLVMFVPAEFKDSEISEEARQGGTFMVLKTENEERAVVSGQVVEMNIDTFMAGLEGQGVTKYETVLNGLYCYRFNITAVGITTSCIVFSTEQDGIVVFSFTLSDQEPYASLYKVMVSSIQPAE